MPWEIKIAANAKGEMLIGARAIKESNSPITHEMFIKANQIPHRCVALYQGTPRLATPTLAKELHLFIYPRKEIHSR